MAEWHPREPPLITINAEFFLDRWRDQDGPARRRFDGDPETARFFGWTVEQATALPDQHYDGPERARANLRDWLVGGKLLLAIRRRADGEAVGWVELRPEGDQTAVSYLVAPEERGHGLASRALAVLLEWTARETPLQEISLTGDLENAASQRVAAKTELVSADGEELGYRRALTSFWLRAKREAWLHGLKCY